MSQSEILQALQEGPKSVPQLMASTGESYKATKRALQRLEGLKEIRGTREVCECCGTSIKKWEKIGYI